MKKYFFLLFAVGIIFISLGSVATKTAMAAPCQFITENNITWGTGRISDFNINVVNNNGCPNGFGTTQGSVLLNDTPATITSWGQDSISVTVPPQVEGLANIKVIASDGVVYGTSQLLVSLKITSYPSQLTLGDQLEINGEGFNNSEAGKVVNLSVGGYASALPVASWSDARIVLSTANSYFKIGTNTLKVYYGSSNQNNGYQSPSFDVNVLAPACGSFKYSDWGACSPQGQQSRTVVSSSPSSCIGGNPILSQSCTPILTCTTDDWSCSSWGSCAANGIQNRSCNKISNCVGGTPSPSSTQSCTYVPPYTAPSCSVDTWQCGDWGSCSPQGIQTRSCTKTFDCSSVETASPPTSQYCVAPNQPKLQTPTEDLGIANQSTIIRATVKLICPIDKTMASQGSGTVIDSSGTILTNKHVVDGTPGCLVGFIDNYNDEPYFGDRQIADIYKVSSDTDVAILKLRNPTNRILTYISLGNSNSSNLGLGDKITTYGYPAKFGTKITYTSGDFSGVDGNYLKTTAIIEHGNSGGGAYLKNGTFIGIPSAVVKGSLNSMGYLLSVNKVNSWINGSSYVYDSGSSNSYSRVSSVLENIDLNTLNSLNLFIADSNGSGQNNPSASTNNKSIDKNLQNKLKGYILLQTESKGEAWYVNPIDGKRYYMKDGASAYSMMRKFGVGITNTDLKRLPQVGEKKAYPTTMKDVKGKILLQVQSKGEAWYVYPKTGLRYYLKNGDEAYKLMRNYSIGITNKDLEKIPAGNL